MIALGCAPGPEGYAIEDHATWSDVYRQAIATLPESVVDRARKEMQKGVQFIKQVEEYHRATRDLLVTFPWAASESIKERSHHGLLRLLGYSVEGLEEEVGATSPPAKPLVAEIGKASYYCGAGLLEKEMDNVSRLRYVEDKLPALWKRFNPRRYQVPDGFGQPKHLAILAAAAEISALTGFRQYGPDPHASGPIAYLALARLGALGVPTYFVGREMTEALMRTDLPEKFALEDVRWPMAAMQICLPHGGLVDGLGHSYTTMVIAQVDANIAYRIVPEIEDPGVTAPSTAIVTLAFSPTATGVACWHHELNSDPVTIGSVDDFVRPVQSAEDRSGDDASRAFADTCRRLALQVMMAMVARPEMIEIEALARPPKIKGGKEIHPGLWTPNFIGRAYRAKIAAPTEGEGEAEAGKKRTHWRRGHFRNYLIARGFKEDKTLWIEPMLVNAPE